MNRKHIAGACYALLVVALLVAGAWCSDYQTIVPAEGYRHDRWGTQPRDIVREFRAYVSSFDGTDDNDGDGQGECWGVPEWVAYEIKRYPTDLGKSPDRPNPWITDEDLHRKRIAPNDDSYKNGGYDRGHMCMKYIAFRLGKDADWNTHTVLNACPQEAKLNQYIWKDLEERTAKWADEHGSLWVVCGPVFLGKKVKRWVGDPGEVPVAVSDAFFKIVIRESGTPNRPDALAFIYPHHARYPTKKPYDHRPYLVSIDLVESLTGLDFLTALSEGDQKAVEKVVPKMLWGETAAVTGDQEAVVYVTRTGKAYHKEGCQYLSTGGATISLEEAKTRGLRPCSRCKPPR